MPDSSSDQVIAEEIIATQFQLLLGNYTNISVLVLWFCDFFLTLPTEVRSIWPSQLTGTSILFILNRYGFLFATVIQLPFYLPGNMTDTSCGNFGYTSLVFYGMTGAVGRLLSSLRVYALFGQKRSLLILLSLYIIAYEIADFSLTFPGLKMITSQGTIAEPFLQCIMQNDSSEFNEMWIIGSPLAMLAFDSTILILTLVRTFHHVMQSRKSGIRSIAEVILRDGTLYFFPQSCIYLLPSLYLLDSMLLGDAVSFPLEQAESIILQFLKILPTLLINHFILNLRAFGNGTTQHSGTAPSTSGTTATPPLSALNFAENRFIGNIGAPLDPNQWDEVGEVENAVEQRFRFGNIEWEIPDRAVDPLTTLVPVIYDYEKGGAVRFVPMQREAGLSQLLS
ncbi:hypothetical protein BDP27DRAFT_1450505 [Rhodocollybia butyracea]|uniref:DUF6533 domain-containing protein n=1 Tax=Rhodocollybia butyracea TaxID=206335 RepID=A0A9P5PKG9_9AGAR|nr:hypothetical protein BDP27DRAFT_1450505 [Rhodocollybia butyracea]